MYAALAASTCALSANFTLAFAGNASINSCTNVPANAFSAFVNAVTLTGFTNAF